MARIVGVGPLPAVEVSASLAEVVGGAPQALLSTADITPGASLGPVDAEFVVQTPRDGNPSRLGHHIERFSGTIGGLSNVSRLNGQAARCMEPGTCRTRMQVKRGSVDGTRADFARQVWESYEKLAEGFWNGGVVRIQRIVDGVLTDVRTDTIVEHRASSWVRHQPGSHMLPPDATSFRVKLPSTYERGVSPYFGVCALDKYGNPCEPAVISIPTPAAGAAWNSVGDATAIVGRAYPLPYKSASGAFTVGDTVTAGTKTGTIRAVTDTGSGTGFLLVEPPAPDYAKIGSGVAISAGGVTATSASTAVPGGPDDIDGDSWMPDEFSAEFAAPASVSLTEGTTADSCVISWPAVPGAYGYMILFSHVAPANMKGYGITLAAGGEIKVEDMCWVSKTIYQPSINGSFPDLRGADWTASNDDLLNWTVRVPGIRDGNGSRVYYDNVSTGSVEYVAFTGGDPSPSPVCGTSFLRVVANSALPWEDRWTQFSLNGSTQGRAALELGNRYRMSAWVRTTSGTKRVWMGPINSVIQSSLDEWVQDTADGSHPNRDEGLGFGEFDVTTEWRELVVEFWVPSDFDFPDNSTLGSLTLRMVTAGEYHIGVFRCWALGPADNATGPVTGGEDAYGDMLRSDRTRIGAVEFGVLRFHGGVKAAEDGYDVAGWTNLPGGCNGGTYQQGETVIQQVRMALATGKGVWFQPPPHFSRQEWQDLMCYFAQPYEPGVDDPALKPWAHKRYAQRVLLDWAPYDRTLLDEFSEIVWWEMGNEMWNPLFYPMTAPNGMIDEVTGKKYSAGQAHGALAQYMLDSFAALDFWAAIKDRFEIVCGGHARGMSYGEDAVRMAPGITALMIANYIGGWDEQGKKPWEWNRDGSNLPVPGTPHQESYQVMMTSAMSKTRPRAKALVDIARSVTAQRRVSDPTAPALRTGLYEAGPGYVQTGLAGQTVTAAEAREQLRVKTSLASAVSVVDCFMLMASLGFDMLNWFALNDGDYFGAYAPVALRADKNGQFFLPVKLCNAVTSVALPGTNLPVRQVTVPVEDVEGYDEFPLVAAYATRPGGDATKLAVVVVNRALPWQTANTFDVRLRVPVLSCESLRVYRFPLDTAFNVQNGGNGAQETVPEVGAPFDDIDIETISVPVPSDPRVLTITDMPPASAAIYLWGGIGTNVPVPVITAALDPVTYTAGDTIDLDNVVVTISDGGVPAVTSGDITKTITVRRDGSNLAAATSYTIQEDDVITVTVTWTHVLGGRMAVPQIVTVGQPVGAFLPQRMASDAVSQTRFTEAQQTGQKVIMACRVQINSAGGGISTILGTASGHRIATRSHARPLMGGAATTTEINASATAGQWHSILAVFDPGAANPRRAWISTEGGAAIEVLNSTGIDSEFSAVANFGVAFGSPGTDVVFEGGAGIWYQALGEDDPSFTDFFEADGSILNWSADVTRGDPTLTPAYILWRVAGFNEALNLGAASGTPEVPATLWTDETPAGVTVLEAFDGLITFTVNGGTSGTYADGSHWTTGQITAMLPALDTNATRTTLDLTEYTGTTAHGWRVNPGLSPSGSALAEKQSANSGTFTNQSYDSLVIGTNAAYDATLRAALPITAGSVVKARSQMTGIQNQGRPVLSHLAVCTVVASAPAAGSLRPPLADPSKTPRLNTSTIDLTLLENFDATGYAIPAYADALSWLTALHTHENTFNVGHRNIVGQNGADGGVVTYFGDMADKLSQVLLAMHFNAWTTEQKTQIAIRLGVWAQDIAARTYEGGVWQDFGGHAHGRLPVLAFCAELFDSQWLRDACAIVVEAADTVYNVGALVYGDLSQLAYVTQTWIDLGQPEQDAGGEFAPAWAQAQLGWPGWAGSAQRRETTNTPYNILGHVSFRPVVSSPPAYQDAGYIHIVGKSLGAARLAVHLIGADSLTPQLWRDYADRYMGWWINDNADPAFVLPQPSVSNKSLGTNATPAWVAQVWNVNVGGRTAFWPSDYPAPTLSVPTQTDITATTATIGITTNQATNRVWAVVTTSSTAPTAAQVKAGQDHTGAAAVWAGLQVITTTGDKTFSVTGLTAATAYHTHFVHENAWAKTSSVASGTLTTAGAHSFTARSVRVSSADDFAFDVGVLSEAGSSEGMFCGWVYYDGTWNTPSARIFRLVAGATIAFDVFTSSSGRISTALSGVTNFVSTPTGVFAGNRWHHIALSWKAGAGGWYQLSVDGAAPINGPSLLSATLALDGTITGIAIGSTGATNRWNGDLGHFYCNVQEALDLSVQANREKFILSGSPVDLGEFGQIPTGTAPLIYMDGDGAGWDNVSGGPTFTVTGTIVAGGTPAL